MGDEVVAVPGPPDPGGEEVRPLVPRGPGTPEDPPGPRRPREHPAPDRLPKLLPPLGVIRGPIKKATHHLGRLHPQPPDELCHIGVVVDPLVGVGVDGDTKVTEVPNHVLSVSVGDNLAHIVHSGRREEAPLRLPVKGRPIAVNKLCKLHQGITPPEVSLFIFGEVRVCGRILVMHHDGDIDREGFCCPPGQFK